MVWILVEVLIKRRLTIEILVETLVETLEVLKKMVRNRIIMLVVEVLKKKEYVRSNKTLGGGKNISKKKLIKNVRKEKCQ